MPIQGYGQDRKIHEFDANYAQRGDPLEVSLTMVPPNHPSLLPKNLEAEASGLLDRMLSVFQENVR